MKLSGIIVVSGLLVFSVGCAGGGAAKKKEKAVNMEAAKAAAEQSAKQMNDQMEVAKKEETVAKEEVVEKKAMVDKCKSDLMAVRDLLIKMGVAAERVNVVKVGDVFRYQDQSSRTALAVIKDPDVVSRLDAIVEQQKNKDNDAMDFFNGCSGGFETCIDGQMYLQYMVKDGGTCTRTWYLVDRNCK